jgi:hypothetical protein
MPCTPGPGMKVLRWRTTRLGRVKYAKMVMVVRSDLRMGKGRIAAQCWRVLALTRELELRRVILHGAIWQYQSRVGVGL